MTAYGSGGHARGGAAGPTARKGGVGAGPGHAARPWYAAAQMNQKSRAPADPPLAWGSLPRGCVLRFSRRHAGITSWIKGRRSVDGFKILEW